MESSRPNQAAPPNARHDTGAGPDTQPSGAASTDNLKLAFLAPPQAPDELGRLGPYRILGELGHGGMGMVFRAEDPQLKRQIALKVMLPQYAANPLAMKRFLREAEAQAAVEHDHIIPIFQVGEDRGTPFIAMPLLKGQTLAAALKAAPRLPVSEVIRIGREMAEGLAAAHEKGLIHRDIKPGNVWLEGERRRVKILDFGLARAEAEQSAEGDEPITASGTIVGTPSYMAPEQARALPVDFRTDLFSLGVVLYQMATGQLPFTGANTMAILTALAVDTPRPPRELTPELPPSLSVLIQRLLAKNPSQRPQSAHAVAEDLRQHELAMSVSVQAIPLGALPEAVPDVWSQIAETETNEVVHRPAPAVRKPAPVSREAQPSAPRRGTPIWVWAIAAVGFLAVVGGAVVVFQQVTKVTTPKGTLVIESSDPDVEVIVKKDGVVLVDKTKQREIELKVGDGYTIELAEKKDGLRLNTDKFTITKDGKSTVKVFVEKAVAAKPKDKTTANAADRQAIEALHPFVHLRLKLASGQEPVVAPTDPLPSEPFELVDVLKHNDGIQLPPDFPALVLKALVRQRSFARYTDIYLYARWSEADVARLAELPCRESLVGFTTGLELTPKTVDAIKRFPALTDVSGLDAGSADDATLTSYAALRKVAGGGLYVRELGKSGKVTAKGWAALTGLPITEFVLWAPKGFDKTACELIAKMPHLTSLGVHGGQFDEDGLRALGPCPRLITLYLADCKFPPQAARQFATFANLQVLDLTRTSVTADDIPHLAAVTSLRTLGIVQTKIDAPEFATKLNAALPRCIIGCTGKDYEPSDAHYREAIRLLARGGIIVHVQLKSGPIVTAKTVAELPADPFTLVAIKSGHDKANSITDADLVRLGATPTLTAVEVVVGSFDEPGLRAIALSKATLSVLYLDQCPLNDNHLRILSDCTELRNLHIGAKGSKVTDAGIAHLTKLQKIDSLTLADSALTDDGLKHLGGLTTIRILDLSGTRVSDTGIDTLVGLKRLEHLGINETRVTATGVKRLQDALPKCKIEWSVPKPTVPIQPALVFDGKTTHVRLPFSPTDAKPYTVEAWVKFDAPTSDGYSHILSAYNPGRGMGLFRSPQGKIRFGERVGLWQDTASELQPQGRTDWVHVAGVWDGKASRLYVNGVRQPHEIRNDQPQAQIDAYNQPWMLGASQPVPGEPVQNFFAGQMREVRFSMSVRYDKDFTPATRHEPDKDTYALYRCDDGQGDELKDSSGGNRHGKIVGATWVKPTAARGLQFDGKTAHVVIHTLSRDEDGPITIEAFVTVAQTQGANLVRLEGKFPCQMHGWPGPNGATEWVPNGIDHRGLKFQGGTPALTPGKRTHVAFQIDGESIRLFIDGKLANTAPRTTSAATSKLVGALIGAGGDPAGDRRSDLFAGTLDEIRISKVIRYKGDFTPTQRHEPDKDTLALYHCDDGQGDKLTDSSGNGHHGKIVGATWVTGGSSVPAPEQANAAKALGVSVQVENSIGMKLNLIPAGRFLMGSPNDEPSRHEFEGPQQEATVSQRFSMGVHEVTVGQFRAFINDTGYQTDAEKKKHASRYHFDANAWKVDPNCNWRNPVTWQQTDDHPVVGVTGSDAVEFCKWLSQKEGKLYRLPTSTEWEYCCRAGTMTRFASGEAEDGLKAVANLADESIKKRWPTFSYTWGQVTGEDSYAAVAPVGRFKANAWGLFDMHGNVFEWCAEVSDGRRMIRGGSWLHGAVHTRAAYREFQHADLCGDIFGFRVVCEVRPAVVGDRPKK